MGKDNNDLSLENLESTSKGGGLGAKAENGLREGLTVSCCLKFNEFEQGRRLLENEKRAKKGRSQKSQPGSNAKGISKSNAWSYFIFFVIVLFGIGYVHLYLPSSSAAFSGPYGAAYRFFDGFLLGLLTLLIIMGVYSVVFQRGSLARDFCGGKFSFSVKFYDDFLFIEQIDGIKTIALYTSGSAKIIEHEKLFLIVTSAVSVYVVPKRCLNERKTEKIREYAKKFEERYIVETKI